MCMNEKEVNEPFPTFYYHTLKKRSIHFLFKCNTSHFLSQYKQSFPISKAQRCKEEKKQKSSKLPQYITSRGKKEKNKKKGWTIIIIKE